MRANGRSGLLALLAFIGGLLLSATLQAQGYPQRTIRIVVPYPAGGNTDLIARVIAQSYSEAMGQGVIVENRPGANGTIALEAVAQAPADGHTLLVTAVAQLAIVPQLMKTRYEPQTDFVPVSLIATNPLVLVVKANAPTNTLREFIDYAKSRNGHLPYASSGEGGIPHLTAVQFMSRAGLQMVHVPYKGSGQVLSDIIGGHVPSYFANLSEVLPHAGKGTLKFLAQTGNTRVTQLADVPTVAEQGYEGFKSITWNGLLAPKGTPKAIIDKLSDLTLTAMRDNSLRARMSAAGLTPVGSTPQQLADTLRSDIATWAEAVRMAGLKSN